MFDQIFPSPQVIQSVIISNRHGIYKLTQKLTKVRKHQENLKTL